LEAPPPQEGAALFEEDAFQPVRGNGLGQEGREGFARGEEMVNGKEENQAKEGR